MSEINNTTAQEQNYQKIGGWLILPGIGIVLAILQRVLYLGRAIIPIFFGNSWAMLTTPGTDVYHQLWGPLIIYEAIGNTAFLVFSLVLAFFFFQRKKAVPVMMIAFYISQLIYSALDHFLGNLIPLVASQDQTRATSQFIGLLIGCFIWIPYFLVSKRVRGTFVN